MPSPRPVKPSPSLVVALMLIEPAAQPQIDGDVGDHRGHVRRELRRLRDDRRVDVAELESARGAPAARPGAAARGCRHPCTPRRCRGNACRCRLAPNAPRIASQIAWSSTSASECPARPRSNGIVTPPSTSRRPATSAWTSKPVPTRTVPMLSAVLALPARIASASANVFGIGHLDVGGAALHQPRLDAQRLDRLRLVEQLCDVGPPQRMVEDRVAEHLRRLGAPQPAARLGRCRAHPGADFGALERIAQRYGEQSADRLVLELVQQAMQRRHVDARSHGIVHQHPVFGLPPACRSRPDRCSPTRRASRHLRRRATTPAIDPIRSA